MRVGWRIVARLTLMACTIGALAGFGELAVLAVDKYLKHRLVGFHLDSLWMKPPAEALLFAAAGTLTGVLALRSAFLRRYGAVAAIALGLFSVQWVYHRRMHPLAAAFLSVGAAYQIWLIRERWPRVVDRLRRPAVAAVCVTAAALAGVALVLGADQGRASALRVPAGGRPNVLLVVLDTVRAQSLSLHGYGRDTSPELSGLARRGAHFRWAMATAPWTAPSHASLFTGRLPHEVCPGRYQRCSDTAPTVAEYLRSLGYRTAGFVGNSKMATAELGFGRGFDLYRDHPRDLSELARHAVLLEWLSGFPGLRRATGQWELLGRFGAGTVISETLDWIARRGDEPWFAFVNLFDAHDPYLPPEPWASRFARTSREDPWLVRSATLGPRMRWNPAHLPAEQDAYDASVAYVDSMVGHLIARLQQAGALGHTLIIVTSDHGEEFGEDGRVGHGRALTTTLLHVPLVMIWPDEIPAGTVCPDPVTLADLPATLAAAASEAPGPFPGRTLGRCWTPGAAAGSARPVVAELGEARSVTTGPWHFVRNRDGREMLYDLRDNPLERVDRRESPGGQAVLPALRQALQSGGR